MQNPNEKEEARLAAEYARTQADWNAICEYLDAGYGADLPLTQSSGEPGGPSDLEHQEDELSFDLIMRDKFEKYKNSFHGLVISRFLGKGVPLEMKAIFIMAVAALLAILIMLVRSLYFHFPL